MNIKMNQTPSNTDANNNSKSLKIAIRVGIAAVVAVGLYAVFLIWVTRPIEKYTIANAGVFGDSFGVLTSLFSALAFAGVAFTIASQREEIKNQREEAGQQKKHSEDNQRALAKQAFENNFFQMLKLHNQIVSEIKQEGSNIRGTFMREGRVVIKNMSDELKSSFRRGNIDGQSTPEMISERFDTFYDNNGYQLAHYFRFLYNICRFISESHVENKNLYIRLMRAQISNQELFILYYNALTERGTNFQKYLIEFKLMDNLSSLELFSPEHKEFVPDCGIK